MLKLKMQPVAVCLLLLLVQTHSLGQRRNRNLACNNAAFAALKPLPELTYQCPSDVNSESDDSILKSPQRINAISHLKRELQSLTDPLWWAASVDDLNVCYLRGKAGPLSAEEREQFNGEEYQVRLMGNNRIRLVLTPDPCYQTYFNGANAFLLYKRGAHVYVTEVLDGYFSRLAKSVSIHFLRSHSEQVIEIETANITAMRPDITSYYFVIDRATGRAVPKKFSRRGNPN